MFYAYTSWFSMDSASFFANFVERVKAAVCRLGASSIISNIFSVFLSFCFALVGTLLGAMTGAFIGQETESGFVRGAAVGAISGAVFSIEVFEKSLVIWKSDEFGFKCLLCFLADVIVSLFTGRLVRERLGPAMLSAVLSQMGAVESSFEDGRHIFDINFVKGLPEDSLEKIPKIQITSNDIADASGENVCCSVCLQDFHVGDNVRCLPNCHHLFHLPCIDKWLLRNASCPLCRREV